MGKNTYDLSKVAQIYKPRSRFDLSHRIFTSGNVGTLYPFDVQEVYPGDTFKERIACVTRLSSTFVRPIMDNLFLDVAYFYCPSRLVDDNFESIFGKGEPEDWAPTSVYKAPYAYGNVAEKSVADYMGVFPPKNSSNNRAVVSGCPVTLYPFRIFAKIWNEWFRDENLEQAVYINKTSSESSKQFNSNAWSSSNYMGMCPKVNKFHDIYTSCLPYPQKGSSVNILENLALLPVGATSTEHAKSLTGYGASPLKLEGVSMGGLNVNYGYYLGVETSAHNKGVMQVDSNGVYDPESAIDVTPTNLYADPSGLSINVNDLRYALALQRIKELDARGGTRYIEYILSHFGISNPDGRLQRSEMLSYKRTPISITQVTQTSGFEGESDTLGQVGAYSLTGAKSYFTKGFTEHGYVIGVFCLRQFHTYQNGIHPLWFKREKYDFYDPLMANIGEQPIYTRSLYYDGTNAASYNRIFGYNEAYVDLRQTPNRVSGQMRSGVTNSLDMWHLADNYTSTPYLNASWLNETKDYVDGVITVESSQQDQFILDFYIQHLAYRRLPSYSTPKII